MSRRAITRGLDVLRTAVTAVVTGRVDAAPGRQALIDALEPRRMLSLTLFGTSESDIMDIAVASNNDIGFTLNGALQVLSPPGDGVVLVRGGEGNDLIRLKTTGTLNFDLGGEAGSDSYEIGTGVLYQQVKRDVTVTDNIGNNQMLLNDELGLGELYGIDPGSLELATALGTPTIQLLRGTGQSNTIRLSNSEDRLSVLGIPDNTLIDLRGGDDEVDLGGPNDMVATDLPDQCTINAGSGTDILFVDDTNAASPRTNIIFDDSGLAGSVNLVDFSEMHVNLHQLAGGAAEPLIFRGTRSFAPSIKITGVPGSDIVRIGEGGTGVFASQFASVVRMDLLAGFNQVEIADRNDGTATTWTLAEAGAVLDPHVLQAASGTQYQFLNGIPLVFRSIVLTLIGSGGDDVFSIVDTPDTWNIQIHGAAGNDRLQMGGVNDLDNVFDCVAFHYTGDTGVDSMDLNDVSDIVGDADSYFISDSSIRKEDAAGPTTILVHDLVENLLLHADPDNNNISFDLSNFDDAEIFGDGGNDTFTNKNTILPFDVLSTTLGTAARLHGGSGTDVLKLDDRSGDPGVFNDDYAVEAARFIYSRNLTIRTVQYDGFNAIELYGSGQSNLAEIRQKPSGATLFCDLGTGDDTIRVGGGDLDSNGFFSAGATLLAGTGNDHIIFDDQLDRDASGETENYTFGNLSISKGALTLLYSTFENQTLLAANGVNVGQLNTIPVVNLNSISGFLDSTTINGGPARGCIVNVGATDLNNISGVVNVNLGGNSIDQLTVNDAGQTFGSTSSFEINNSQVVKTSNAQTINYSGVGQITLNTRNSTISDSINVKSVPAGTSVIVNANAGNDNITLGNGNIDANLLGPITINGGAGIDNLGINNGLDNSAETLTLNVFSFIDSGITHTFTGVDGTMTVGLGNGGTNLTINGTATRTNVFGGSGNDTFTVGGGDIDGNLTATVVKGLFIGAGGGVNTLRLDDLNDTNLDNYIFQRPSGLDQFVKRDGTLECFVTWENMTSVTLDASNAPTSGFSISSILVMDVATPLRINGNAGGDAVQINDGVSPVFVNTGLGDRDNLSVNGDLDGLPITVTIDQSDDIENLSIFPGGTLRVTNGATLLKTRLGLNPAIDIFGVLDLGGGALVSRSGGPTPAQFRTQIIAGRNGGAWNGTGTGAGAINSSLAATSTVSDGVGYGLGSEIAPTSIGGFTIAAGDTLVRHTLDGDADLNQQVNIADFSRTSAHFNGTNKVWTTGDSNYDNTTNVADFSPLAANFNQSVASSLPRSAAVSFGGSPFGLRAILDLSDVLN